MVSRGSENRVPNFTMMPIPCVLEAKAATFGVRVGCGPSRGAIVLLSVSNEKIIAIR
jgi:hypothetical protein